MAQSLQGDGKLIFTIFIGAIITVVLLASISDSVFTQVNTATGTNITVTAGAVNVSIAIEGRQLLVATSVINGTTINLASRGAILSTATVNGLQTVALTLNDSASNLAATVVNATYTYNPDGFIDNGGGRNITNLIPLFSALAILVFVIVVLFKQGSFSELIGRGKRRRE